MLTIGRSDAADIVLDDMTVSRRHAVVGAAENGCFIEDQFEHVRNMDKRRED